MGIGRSRLRLTRRSRLGLVGGRRRLAGLLGLVTGLVLGPVGQLDDVDVDDALGLQASIDAGTVVRLQSKVILVQYRIRIMKPYAHAKANTQLNSP